MENRFPKNVRQIGNVSDTPKIYIEDYVDTFLNQLCDGAKETAAGAFLVGHTEKQDGQECIYIYGAVRLPDAEREEAVPEIEESMVEKAKEEAQKYFGNAGFVGWFLARPEQPLQADRNLERIHEKHFGQAGSVLIMKEPSEKEEVCFAWKYKELMQMGGHYIYYEKNPAMQNYMIMMRKKIGVTPSEVVPDQAAKNFRNIVQERFEIREQRRNSRFMYATSVFLVLVVLIIGITTINNYDKMQLVQSAIEDIRSSVSAAGTEEIPLAEKANKVNEEKSLKEENPKEKNRKEESAEKEAEKETETKDSGEAENNGVVSTMQEMSEDIYIVEKGDTLARISKKVYGDIGHVDAICRMNGLKDGNLIFIGQKLLLP